ncbi:MAG TPA: DUF4232 domain-containing protein [Candidatus Saccharimonadales bacterium]|nr:DUF4232 domain-containing protein [Candidatus Saccharimonadales bacterium]
MSTLSRLISHKAALALAVLLAVAIAELAWQQSHVSHLNQQLSDKSAKLSNEKKTNASLTKKNADLGSQLSKAIQSINSLSQHQSFVEGAACQTQQLSLAPEGRVLPAAGNRYMMFTYQNTSNTECTLKGFPGLLALSSDGYVMPNGPVKTELQPSKLTLNPNDKAYFFVHWDAGGNYPNERCITTSLIESTPPGNTYPLITSMSVEMCEGFISVSALGTADQYSNYLR